MKNLKKFLFIVILFVIFFITSANSYSKAVSKSLSDTFFRLHILANSDSEDDQTLKLKVRDKIIDYMKTLTISENNKEDILKISKKHLSDFKKIAEDVIKENGYNYDVSINIGNYYFPTKQYGDISLPSGYYDALRIEIGQAEGQNWWCSLFPPLCFVDISSGILDENGKKYLENNLSEEELKIVKTNSTEIKLKFKIIEFFN